MRRATLLFTLSASLHLSAQDFPFPTTDATWVQYFELMVTQPPMPIFELASTTNLCMDGSDTLIAGVSYNRLRHCNFGYVGGIRSVDEAVYFFPADSTQEYLLYDFGSQVGDTVFDVFVNEGLAYSFAAIPAILLNYRVAQVGQVEGRKWVMLEPLWSGPEQYWIEGFGSPYGLFSQQSPMNISGYGAGIWCMSHQDTTWYFNEWEVSGMPGTCTPQYVGVEEEESTGWQLFPNPTSALVHAQGAYIHQDLQVYDALGRTVRVSATRVNNQAVEVDLGSVPSGIYLIRIGNAVIGRVVRE